MVDATVCNKATENASKNVVSVPLPTNIIFSDDDLREEAKTQFSYYTEILHAFQLNARNVLANDRLSPTGRHLFCMTLERDYTNCKHVLNYLAAHPELTNRTRLMPPPLVLCGVPRTGTTLLLNLLACDPASRAPLLMDMLRPVPPLARSDIAGQAQRNSITDTLSETCTALGLTDYQQKLRASHARYEYEEDKFILFHAGLAFFNLLLAPDDNTELETWFFDTTNKDFVYAYHKTFLQMLNNVDAPHSHWLLKWPSHILFLDTLLRYYPSASFIMNHRRLDEVLASWVRMGTLYISAYVDNNKTDVATERHMVMKRLLHALGARIHSLMEFRRSHPDTPVVDIYYDDLMEKPIETVHHIYEQLGLTWSEEFEVAMLAWLRENPQGKQGRNPYKIEEFGLTAESLDQRFKEYHNMFLKTREASKTDYNSGKNMDND